MQHEIIMPALGMAQKTGLIVAWHKAPGDAVKASDILLDVETDKSTMEVEAGHDGYVAALMAGAGDDVPVGSAIAIISSEKPNLASQPAQKPQPATAPVDEKPVEPEPVAAKPVQQKQPASATTAMAAPQGGKILASPKAKRIAFERGIDLGRLVALGKTQPFHAADLESLPAPAAVMAIAMSEIEASVEPAGLKAMLGLLEAEGVALAPLLAAFAASSVRIARDGDQSICVRVEQGGKAATYADPDHAPLSRLLVADTNATDIIVRDFTNTGLVSMRLAGDTAPVLTLTGDFSRTSLRLTFDSSHMTPTTAAAVVTGFAARLHDPLRQLL